MVNLKKKNKPSLFKGLFEDVGDKLIMGTQVLFAVALIGLVLFIVLGALWVCSHWILLGIVAFIVVAYAVGHIMYKKGWDIS